MFKKILFPVDLGETELSEAAMNVAIQEAQNHGAELHCLSVLPGFGMPWVATYFPRDALSEARKSLETRLKEYVERHVPREVKVSHAVREGTPYREILAEVKRVGADLIVIPSQDTPEVDRVLLGSCAARVVEHSHVSVMVIRRSGK